MLHPPTTSASFLRHRSLTSERGLPLAVIMLAALTALVSFAMGFGLLSFSLIQHWRQNLEPAARVDLPKPVAASPVSEDPAKADREIPSIQQRLAEATGRVDQLRGAEEQASKRTSSLRDQESQLTPVVEQRRRALLEAEDKTRRFTEEQQRAAERVQVLRAEAADLERRIAALRAMVDAANRTAASQAATQRLTPQLIECVRGGVILKPQQVRISSSDLGNGQLAALASKQGVYFLVKPTGLDSFIAARNVARAAGVVVGYEPSRSGTEKQP